MARLARVLGVDAMEFARDCGVVFENALDAERHRLGLSKAAFAARVGVGRASLSSPAPLPRYASRIALALGGDREQARAAADRSRDLHRLHRSRCPLGDLIDDWVASNGSSSCVFAQLVGVSRQAVAQWRLGASVPSTPTAARVARVLGVSVDAIESRPVRQAPAGALGQLIDDRGEAMTLSQIAERVGVSQSAVAAWRMGTARPGPGSAARLADVLGVARAEIDLACGGR